MRTTDAENVHRSVLLDESLELLEPQRGGLFVDATLGMGGHSEAILDASDSTTFGAGQRGAGIKGAAALTPTPFWAQARRT